MKQMKLAGFAYLKSCINNKNQYPINHAASKRCS